MGYQAEPVVFISETAYYRHGIIGRAIIDHDNLQVAQCLAYYRLQTIAYDFLYIIDRYDY